MITVQTLERLVPDGVRVRPVPGGFILSDGQWTTALPMTELPAHDDPGAEPRLKEHVARAVLILRAARDGSDVSAEAQRMPV